MAIISARSLKNRPLGTASQLEAETGTNNTQLMTPLRVAQAIAALGSGSPVGIENFTITAPILSTKQVTLAFAPTTPAVTLLTPLGGIHQEYGVDFTITGNILSWSGLGLDGYFILNDKFSVIYK